MAVEESLPPPMSPLEPPTRAHRIATALLDVLAATGDAAGRGRVMQALGGEEASLRSGRVTLPEDRLATAFRAVPVDRPLARRVGRALVASSGLGLFFRYSGVAGPEKAYRRCNVMLARECDSGEYRTEEIVDGSAVVHFTRGDTPTQSAGDDAPLCGVREGMLEALPSLFGLPLARVHEVACAARGADACVFEVRWQRAPRRWLRRGAVVGAVAGMSWTVAVGGGWLAGGALVALLVVLGAGTGRSLDLARQLDVLSGRRREEASWIHDTEGAISAKMDELAKLDAALETREAGAAAGGLRGDGDGAPPAGPTSRHRQADLAAIVERTVEALGREVPPGVELDVRVDTERTAMRCDAFQIEQMLMQLVRNALQAAAVGGSAASIELREAQGGVELSISDDGPGIDEEIVEGVFDPFASSGPAGVDGGFGLPVSYRIARAHGGEIRFESEPGAGTRVSVFLPGDPAPPAADPMG